MDITKYLPTEIREKIFLNYIDNHNINKYNVDKYFLLCKILNIRIPKFIYKAKYDSIMYKFLEDRCIFKKCSLLFDKDKLKIITDDFRNKTEIYNMCYKCFHIIKFYPIKIEIITGKNEFIDFEYEGDSDDSEREYETGISRNKVIIINNKLQYFKTNIYTFIFSGFPNSKFFYNDEIEKISNNDLSKLRVFYKKNYNKLTEKIF